MLFRSNRASHLAALSMLLVASSTASSALADEEIPTARPAPPPVEEPPPNTAPPTPVAREGVGAYTDNALFLELGGPAVLYSVNYDRRLGDFFSLRVGASYLGINAGSTRATAVLVPITFHVLVGGRSWSHFEIGAGAMPAFGSVTTSSKSGASAAGVAGVGVVGYRLQPPDGGFFFRANLNVLVADGMALPWPGLSFGATF